MAGVELEAVFWLPLIELPRLLRQALSPRASNGCFRRTAGAPDLANELPLTTTERSFALMPSDGKVCPGTDLPGRTAFPRRRLYLMRSSTSGGRASKALPLAANRQYPNNIRACLVIAKTTGIFPDQSDGTAG
jgi:hypothetical protein